LSININNNCFEVKLKRPEFRFQLETKLGEESWKRFNWQICPSRLQNWQLGSSFFTADVSIECSQS